MLDKNMTNKLFSFLVLLFFAANSFSQEGETIIDTADASNAFLRIGNFKCDSAIVHLKKNDTKGGNRFYSEAIKEYKKALKMNPNSYNANYQMGIVLTKTKDYKDAILSFDKALSIDGEKSDGFRERGVAQLGMKNDSMAMKDFNKAIDKNYDDYQAYFQRAMLKLKNRKTQAALEDYTHAIESKPNYKEAYMKRGLIYFNNVKDYVLALNDFNKMIEFEPENMEAFLYRGKTNFQGGAFKNADKDLSKYIDTVSYTHLRAHET
jgi:tetratricopeptide (TPR) repeat protein